jgi:hypothetical protein
VATNTAGTSGAGGNGIVILEIFYANEV